MLAQVPPSPRSQLRTVSELAVCHLLEGREQIWAYSRSFRFFALAWRRTPCLRCNCKMQPNNPILPYFANRTWFPSPFWSWHACLFHFCDSEHTPELRLKCA